MNFNPSAKKQFSPISIDAVAGAIAQAQHPSGEIPWSPKDKTDPWDHVEAAMGLTIGGYYQAARKAFHWLAGHQLEDGSWYAEYRDGVPVQPRKDPNMSSYIAAGLYHYYRITNDIDFLKRMWKPMQKAIDFALSMQSESGEIFWSKDTEGNIDPMALLTGSSSIHMSLKCAIAIADVLQVSVPEWEAARVRLAHAIAEKPFLFNMTKSRYSMDWFYPVLSGAVTGDAARRRMEKSWKKFVVKGMGVRCVSDRPWVTIAESAECCLALCAMESRDKAEILFQWICDKQYEDGSYWCGFTFPDMTVWPEEKTTWTNGVVLMAADALYRLTPAHDLFSHRFWEKR